MKKITAIFLALIMTLALVPFSAYADVEFWDLQSGHWAYQNIQTLVAEGTIKGFEDGSFRPSDTVTRAQFVKMIGKGNMTYATTFKDVASNHWAYEYIMTSGLVSEGTDMFLPEQPITRGEVIELLWKRAGASTAYSAPKIITAQGNNKYAIAWAYSCGIAAGDDGVHLRLDDTMSRAEGAALIIRSREKSAQGATAAFVNTVSEDILKNAFASLDLFDDAVYVPDRKITFGELARATVRIAGSEYTPSYYSLSSVVPFEHKYARDLDVLGRNALGMDIVKASVIDTQPTVGDVVASISFGALHRSSTPFAVNATNDKYNGFNSTKNRLLTFAERHGVQLYTDISVETLNRPATLKDVIATTVLLDSFIGLQTDYSTDVGMFGALTYNHSLDITKAYEGYQLVLKDMPTALYTTPFTSFKESAVEPKDAYRFAQAYTSVFSSSLSAYRSMLTSAGIDCSIVYYPSLVVDNGNGYTMRVKITVNSLSGGATLGSYFKCANDSLASYQLAEGKTFYADIASGKKPTSITMDPTKMFVDKIVCE